MAEISVTLSGHADTQPVLRAGSDALPHHDQPGSPLKVLVADDDPVMLESLTGLFTDWGYEPISARSGNEALSVLHSADAPRLAVLDCILPDLYGTEICRQLRATPRLHYTYLILLTGREDSTGVVEGLGAGADDYLRKPFDPLELRARLDAGSRIIVQKALRESEQRFESAFEHAGVGMALVDLNGNWLQVNHALCDFLGYTNAELLATRHFQAVTHPEDLPESLHWLKQFRSGALNRAHTRQIEKRYLHKNGSTVWGLLTVSQVGNAEGKPTYFVAQIQDISKRKRAEKELREREAQLQLLLDSTAEAIYGVDLHGKCTFSNRSCLKLLGYTDSAQLVGKDMHSLIHHSHADGTPIPPEQSEVSRSFRLGLAVRVDSEVLWKADGTCFPSEYWAHPVIKDGHVQGCVVTFVDISGRKRTEEALRDEHAESEMFINSVPSILIGTDADGRITRWNLAATNAFSLSVSDVSGKTLKNCGIKWGTTGIEGEIDSWLRCVQRKSIELLFEKDGEQHFLGLAVNRVMFANENNFGLLITGADITERIRLEQQLRQAQKLEAIGQLAAGIAHEINTPTQYVSDNLTFIKQVAPSIYDLGRAAQQLVRESVDGPIASETLQQFHRCVEEADLEYVLEEIPKAVDQSLEGVQRVAKIVHAMKEFSHPGMEGRSALDINRAIETTITVARNEWKYVATVETAFDPALPLVPCYAGEFNQVILNLLVNAAHAIRQALGNDGSARGKIHVATLLDKDEVEISIQDSGCGIPPEIQSRVFEPFFTTKPVGQGTGQGLALAHTSIVRKHNGKLWFETNEGKGTTFFIRLPVAPSVVEQ